MMCSFSCVPLADGWVGVNSSAIVELEAFGPGSSSAHDSGLRGELIRPLCNYARSD